MDRSFLATNSEAVLKYADFLEAYINENPAPFKKSNKWELINLSRPGFKQPKEFVGDYLRGAVAKIPHGGEFTESGKIW